MTGILGPVLTVLGIISVAAIVYAIFRVQGSGSLVNLMEQRIRIQDAEIDRLTKDNTRLQDRNHLLVNGFADTIAQAVVGKVLTEINRGQSGS